MYIEMGDEWRKKQKWQFRGYAQEAFRRHHMGPRVHLWGTANCYKVFLISHLSYCFKHFYPGGSGFFQGCPTHFHRARGFTEWIMKIM